MKEQLKFNPYDFDVFVFDVDECILKKHSLIVISYFLFKRHLKKVSPISLKFFLSGVFLYLFKFLNFMDFQVSNKILLKLFIFGLRGVKKDIFLESVKIAKNFVDDGFYDFFDSLNGKKCVFISFGLKRVIYEIVGNRNSGNVYILSNEVNVEGGNVSGFRKEILWRREDKLLSLKKILNGERKIVSFGHSENENAISNFVRKNGGISIGIGKIRRKSKKHFDYIFRNWDEFLESMGDV